ncbi:MAG: stage III sporulation protein AF [Christensenellales bacterium]|jgi:hypothetical protein
MTLSGWLLSIAGVSLLSVLIDVVLPNGQTNKYIKGIFSFIMVFVIISPIPSLLVDGFKLDAIFAENSGIVIEKDFIYQVNRTKLTFLENQIETELEKQGLLNVEVVVNGDIFDFSMKIKNVYVDLSNLVINPKDKHIDIKKTVSQIVLDFVSLEKEKVIFNE